MFDKRFNIIRYSLIIVLVIVLGSIFFYQKSLDKDEETGMSRDTLLDTAKQYVNDNRDYFNEIINDKDIEIRINTKELVNKKYIESNDNFKGYIKIVDNEYDFIESNDFLVDRLYKDDNFIEEKNNEGMPFDLNYVFKGDPNNFIIYEGNKYRIIGVTNLSDLKIISVNSEKIEKWGTSGNINYFEGKKENETKIGKKGIFYVGFVRSEINDLAQVFKNEKRNNAYTKIVPKYYGYSSYASVSDIINACTDCKYNRINEITIDNCNSYLLRMLKDSYLSTTAENNTVYYVNEKSELKTKTLTENINVYKVMYINGITKYIGGDGSENNPYIIE